MGAVRFLSGIFGTCLGALYRRHEDYCLNVASGRLPKYSVTPAITVRKVNVYALIRVVPPDSGPLWGGKACHPL